MTAAQNRLRTDYFTTDHDAMHAVMDAVRKTVVSHVRRVYEYEADLVVSVTRFNDVLTCAAWFVAEDLSARRRYDFDYHIALMIMQMGFKAPQGAWIKRHDVPATLPITDICECVVLDTNVKTLAAICPLGATNVKAIMPKVLTDYLPSELGTVTFFPGSERREVRLGVRWALRDLPQGAASDPVFTVVALEPDVSDATRVARIMKYGENIKLLAERLDDLLEEHGFSVDNVRRAGSLVDSENRQVRLCRRAPDEVGLWRCGSLYMTPEARQSLCDAASVILQ